MMAVQEQVPKARLVDATQLLIFLTVVACNLLGDRLQQRVDPAAASRRRSTKKNRRAERGGERAPGPF